MLLVYGRICQGKGGLSRAFIIAGGGGLCEPFKVDWRGIERLHAQMMYKGKNAMYFIYVTAVIFISLNSAIS